MAGLETDLIAGTALEQVALPGGGSLRAVVAEPVADGGTGGSGPAVLVLPAMGTPAGYYDRLVAAFAERGVPATAVGWRGTDDGTPPASRGVDWGYRQVLGEDLPRARAWLAERFPGRRPVLLGHSLGGQLGLMHVAQHPGPPLVTVAAGSPYWRHHGRMAPGIALVGATVITVSRAVGHWPGPTIRFAGRESAGVMRDWGTHVLRGLPSLDGLAASLRTATPRVLAVDVAGDDFYAPAGSVDGLLGLAPMASVTRWRLAASDGVRPPGHFRWARTLPDVLVDRVLTWAAEHR